ncbi:hypothetical protein [Paenibacillus paridis]|uniref:hypothetical protein n=1 Tax=Paenibacillus paridis TaxID=2583376 RepID=UPI00111CC4B5|nr:hypothetical protein [Paenibacillus paridis]
MNRKKTLTVLIASQIIYLLFIAVWLFVSAMSVMMFDSADATGDALTWLIFIYILLYPAGLLAALIGGWVLFYRRSYKGALVWNGVPLLWVMPLLGFLVYAQFS